MKSLLLTTLTVLLAGAGETPAPETGGADLYGLIISIDGMRGDYCHDPQRYGLKIPVLRGLISHGTSAKAVRSVFPSVTYPSHATLITGCRPARHGIYSNALFEPPTVRPSKRWYWDYDAIAAPTLIDAARQRNWTTAALSWPVTVGAPVDYLLPEVWDPTGAENIWVAASRHSEPPDLLVRTLTKYDLGPSTDTDEALTRIGRYIVETYRPRLMLLHLVEVDREQHLHGPAAPQALAALEADDARIGQLLDAYRQCDLLDKTVVAIVSDHGFLPVSKQFHPQVVLRQAGLIEYGDDPKAPARDYIAAAWYSGGSCAIMLKDRADRDALAKVRAAFSPYVGPGLPIARVIDRDELDRIGANPQAAMMFDAGDGFMFGTNVQDEVITDPTIGDWPNRGAHGHWPDRPGMEAAFILTGPGVPPGVVLDEIDMLDIAPTLAQALGLQLPTADGHALQKALQGATSRPGG